MCNGIFLNYNHLETKCLKVVYQHKECGNAAIQSIGFFWGGGEASEKY